MRNYLDQVNLAARRWWTVVTVNGYRKTILAPFLRQDPEHWRNVCLCKNILNYFREQMNILNVLNQHAPFVVNVGRLT